MAFAQAGPRIEPRQDTQPDKQALYAMLDDLRAAIRNDDWSEAARISGRLNSTVWAKRGRSGQVSPTLELAHVELLAGRDAITRAPFLPRLARAAYDARQYVKARSYAEEALQAAQKGEFWWTGDAIHQGNIVLGRLALDEQNRDAAARYLLAAGKTPGSSNLNSLGPNMALARDLLAEGRTETVIQYLEECQSFWRGSHGKVAEWLALIRAGLRPDFGPNVGY